MQHPDFPQEQAHLTLTIKEIEQLIHYLHNDMDVRFHHMQSAVAIKDQISAYVHAMLRSDHAQKIHDLEVALPRPYFGRVDFKEDEAEEYESFYIGRTKAAKPDIQSSKDILVFDWRDPVSTIFYECYGGRASYEVLGRYHYSGDVRLKRQYKIEDGTLLTLVDNFILDQVLSRQQEALLADPLLVDRLRQGAADKLKDIVTSIQSEQNKIIREPLHQVTVIQGVAGSGKSTIGLHRLSYLLYNEKLNPKKLLVLAPNRIFLDYICELLPEIDAADVTQLVWEDLVWLVLKEKVTLAKKQTLEVLLTGTDKASIRLLEDTASLKGSLDFVQVLENYREHKCKKFCVKLEDISLFDGQLFLPAKEQVDLFMEDVKAPYNERIRALSQYLRFKVNNFIEIQEAHEAKGKVSEKEVATCKKEGETFLKKYLKGWKPLELLPAYQEVFSNKSFFKPFKGKKLDVDEVCSHSVSLLKQGLAEQEDLAPLAYLSYLLQGWNHINKYDHMVVDEAQDLNPFEFFILKQLSSNSSFTIMGDLSQGIYAHRSISSWNVLIKEIFADARTEYREALYSYRSAKEIIDVFNRVMPPGHTPAIPVYEIGRKPTAESIQSFEHGILRLQERLQAFLQSGAKSIGVITKLERDAIKVHEQLRHTVNEELGSSLHLVCGEAASYKGGISILPVSLAKGLEFDGVILWDASELQFTQTPQDARLLYVALSRAMHSLHIMYQGKLTSLLRKRKAP